jgi:hypothetical protein
VHGEEASHRLLGRGHGIEVAHGRWVTWSPAGKSWAVVRKRNGDQQCGFLTHAIEKEAQLDHTLNERLDTEPTEPI